VKYHHAQGFTLLEVMIALAVLALAMGAIIKATSDYTSNESYLRDRTMAMWVARNELVRLQTSKQWPSTGERKGTGEMGDREWRWKVRISQTDESELRRADVEVYALDSDDDEQPVSVLSGFLMQPDT